MQKSALALLLASMSYAQTPVPGWAHIEPKIAYDQLPETVMDVISPTTQSREKRPAVIAIHGGGWIQGSKDAFLERVLPWVEKGFVAANVEYRLAKVAPAPAAVSDVLKAAEFFSKNAKRWNVDPHRIVVMGASAGGQLALMVALAPKNAKLGPQTEVAAVVNYYGVTDIEDIIGGPNVREFATTWIPANAERAELARKLSPIGYVRKGTAPVLTLQGTDDQIVPYEQGVTLTKALRDVGSDAEMISISGGQHPLTMDQLQATFPQVWAFLQRRGILK